MINRLLFWFSGRLPVRFIRPGGANYIERYYLCTLWGVTFYLHRYTGSDRERTLHDHPWRWSLGIPLCGGYWEQRLLHFTPESGLVVATRFVGWLWPNLITDGTFHCIRDVLPGTWTLFIHGERIKGWGFLKAAPTTTYPDAYQNHLYYTQRKVCLATHEWVRRAPLGRESKREPLHG